MTGFAAIATTIGNYLLAGQCVASTRAGTHLNTIPLAFVIPWIAVHDAMRLPMTCESRISEPP